MNFLGQDFHELEHCRQTYTPTDATERITPPHSWLLFVAANGQYDLRQRTQLSYLPRHLQRHKLQERVYREQIRTVEELQQRITEEWERLY